MSPTIRPVDLPELRAEALLWQDSHGDRMMMQWSHAAKDYLSGISEMWRVPNALDHHTFTRMLWRFQIETLGRADLFFVSREMTALALSAAQALPSFSVQPEDLPSPYGLMLFEDGIDAGLRYDDGTTTTGIQAVSWWSGEANGLGGGVQMTPYVDRQHLSAALLGMDDGNRAAENVRRTGPSLICLPTASFSVPFGERGWKELPDKSAVAGVLPVMLSAWLLMQQPLAQTTEVEPDRAARKRLRRAGQEPKPVRVIELRRPKSSGEPGDGSREYHHQWIVRGHWRQHWYPKRQVHRPVWIAPHIKGPEGAPLIGGEKVYAWKR